MIFKESSNFSAREEDNQRRSLLVNDTVKSANFGVDYDQNRVVKSLNVNSQANSSSTNLATKLQTSTIAQQLNSSSMSTSIKQMPNSNLHQQVTSVAGTATSVNTSTPEVKPNMAPQTNNVPLFHPSKINMSSTPIKHTSNSKEPNSGVNKVEATSTNGLFENDTPIKGHKIKHMLNEQNQLVKLAERYFPRVQPSETKVNSTDENKQSFSPTNLKSKPPAYVQSEELNGRICSKTSSPRKEASNFTSQSSMPFSVTKEETFKSSMTASGKIESIATKNVTNRVKSENDISNLMLMNKSLFKKKMLQTILFDEDDGFDSVPEEKAIEQNNEANSNVSRVDRFKNIYSLDSPPRPPLPPAALFGFLTTQPLLSQLKPKIIPTRFKTITKRTLV